MTAGLPIRPAPAACRISTASPILLHPSLITVFRVVPTLVSHENDSQKTRVSSLAGMEVKPSIWYSSRVTLPSTDPTHWRLTSQPCLCSNSSTPLELIEVLFKTNTKGHKHPNIRLLSRSKTQLVNQRKQKVAFSPGTAHSPEIQSYRSW